MIAAMAKHVRSRRVLIFGGFSVLLALAAGAIALTSAGLEPVALGTTTTERVVASTTAATSTTLLPSITSTTSASTTTTTTPLAPLTGLSVEEPDLLDRSVVGVKIDNHPNARPQSGLESAEAVFEVVVEGGLTRFLALYHTSDTEYLGPMRSGRPTDASLMKPLGGVFVISGASHWISRYLADQGIERLGEGSSQGFRVPGRSAPHNLYVDTNDIRLAADANGISDDPPPTLWHFGSFPEDAQDAVSLVTRFATGSVFSWKWIGDGYQRSTSSGRPLMLVDKEGNDVPFVFDGVVVLRVQQYTARPPSPADGKSVPASSTVGSGAATVFAQGKVVEATWNRQSTEQVFQLVTDDGAELALPPGRYWISLVPTSGSVTWD